MPNAKPEATISTNIIHVLVLCLGLIEKPEQSISSCDAVFNFDHHFVVLFVIRSTVAKRFNI